MVRTTLIGKWRIVDMELWNSDAIDLLGPGFLEIRPDDDGEFQFLAVHGFTDVRYGEVDGMLRAEFSWEGDDDGSSTSGRGWATLVADGTIEGRIFFHMGDDSSFRAIPMDS